MSPLFVEIAFVVTLSWLAWVLLRPYVVRTSLDNIPGPPPHSFVTGSYTPVSQGSEICPCIVSGDLGPLHSPHDGREFHERLGAEFGPVVALRGFLGVRHLLCHCADSFTHSPIAADEGVVCHRYSCVTADYLARWPFVRQLYPHTFVGVDPHCNSSHGY